MIEPFKILLGITSLAIEAYLIYAKFNPSQHMYILNKHKKADRFGILPKIYSDRFLVAWSLLTLVNVSDMVLDIYSVSQPVSNFVFVVSMVISIIALYLLATLFLSKRK